MKQETYNELEKFVMKSAKDDYFIFEVMSGIGGFLLVFALYSVWGNVLAMLMTATGIIVFVVAYLPSDITMRKKIEEKQAMMDEVKKDVV